VHLGHLVLVDRGSLVVVVGHAVYGAVFAPHLVTKVSGLVTEGPTEPLFEGVPDQPQ
jgi:hypothetical protein